MFETRTRIYKIVAILVVVTLLSYGAFLVVKDLGPQTQSVESVAANI
ncbi:hypothetical protein G4V62_18480 [Bacillaceae bacterium SIJ1]|nr:hypothetical protein [Litoribacterium kuwaitense]NGP46828.1 hypothetical protein [Litoribacterium kuwaitense]